MRSCLVSWNGIDGIVQYSNAGGVCKCSASPAGYAGVGCIMVAVPLIGKPDGRVDIHACRAVESASLRQDVLEKQGRSART